MTGELVVFIMLRGLLAASLSTTTQTVLRFFHKMSNRFSSKWSQSTRIPNICILFRISAPELRLFHFKQIQHLNLRWDVLCMRVCVGAFGLEIWPASLILFLRWLAIQHNSKRRIRYCCLTASFLPPSLCVGEAVSELQPLFGRHSPFRLLSL